MFAKDVEGWLLEEAVLLFAQKLPCRGPTGTLLIAEKAALVLAVYSAVRGFIIAGGTLICTLLEPVTETLLGKGFFAGVMKDLEIKSS